MANMIAYSLTNAHSVKGNEGNFLAFTQRTDDLLPSKLNGNRFQ